MKKIATCVVFGFLGLFSLGHSASVLQSGSNQSSTGTFAIEELDAGDYKETINTFDDEMDYTSYNSGSTTLSFYVVTRDSTKRQVSHSGSLYSWDISSKILTYKGKAYVIADVLSDVNGDLGNIRIGGSAVFDVSGRASNKTFFFDDGVYRDTNPTNVRTLSHVNMSIVGIGDTKPSFHKVVPADGRRTYVIMSKNIYIERATFDGEGKDMYRNNSEGEFMFSFFGGSSPYRSGEGFVMRDVTIKNLGTGVGFRRVPKNGAMNFWRSVGQHNFENVVVENIKTRNNFGTISFNTSADNYFSGLVMSGMGLTHSNSIKVEHLDHNLDAPLLSVSGSVQYFKNVRLPSDVHHNHIYVQSPDYKSVKFDDDFRYVYVRDKNGSYSNGHGLRVYKNLIGVDDPVLPSWSWFERMPHAVYDMRDNYWIVRHGVSRTVNRQLADIKAVVDANNSTGTLAPNNVPDYTIKIVGDSLSGDIASFVVPDYGDVAVSIVAVTGHDTIVDPHLKTLVPFAKGGTIELPSQNNTKITLHNFDFHEKARYSLQEAVVGVPGLATGALFDPNEGGSSIVGYPLYSGYNTGEIATGKVLHSSHDTFVNSQFTTLVQAIGIVDKASISTGAFVRGSLRLSAGLSGAENSYTGTGFSALSGSADDATIQWFSTNTGVALVGSGTGLVSFVGTGDVTIYAKAMDIYNDGEREKPFDSISFVVALPQLFYNANGGVLGDVPGTGQVVGSGGIVDKTSETPKRVGHSFLGRYQTATGSQLHDFSVPLTGDVVVYAQWRENTYALSFDANGGTAVASQTGIIYNGTGSQPTPPTKSGYIFGGWYLDNATFASQFNFATGIVQDTVVYAKWNTDNTMTESVTGSSGRGPSGGDRSGSVATTPAQNPTITPITYNNIDPSIFNESFSAQTCFNPLDEETIYQWNDVTAYFRTAHQMFYSYELTRWRGTLDYGPKLTLTREQAARFMVEFAINVLCRKPTYVYTNQFSDIEGADPTLLPFIKQSYEYVIFHGDSGGASKGEQTTFRPKDVISYDELVAVMIRLVTNEYNEAPGEDRAKHYRSFLYDRVNTELSSVTVRDNVAEVIYDLYKLNNYDWKNVGYVIDKYSYHYGAGKNPAE